MNLKPSNLCLCNDFPEDIKYFKEEGICSILCVPENKPNIESICDIFVNAKVHDIKFITTDIGVSNEGQIITGNKLVVELLLEQKLTYVADEPTQSIFAVHYDILKSLFIVLPEYIDCKKVYDLFKSSRFTITPYIEHTDSRLLSQRSVLTCILLLLDVQFC